VKKMGDSRVNRLAVDPGLNQKWSRNYLQVLVAMVIAGSIAKRKLTGLEPEVYKY
jgi:hypothetical protein